MHFISGNASLAQVRFCFDSRFTVRDSLLSFAYLRSWTVARAKLLSILLPGQYLCCAKIFIQLPIRSRPVPRWNECNRSAEIMRMSKPLQWQNVGTTDHGSVVNLVDLQAHRHGHSCTPCQDPRTPLCSCTASTPHQGQQKRAYKKLHNWWGRHVFWFFLLWTPKTTKQRRPQLTWLKLYVCLPDLGVFNVS